MHGQNNGLIHDAPAALQNKNVLDRRMGVEGMRCKSQRCPAQLARSCSVPAAEDLRKVFIDFASFGSRQTFTDMDGAKFFKLCKDTRLVNRAFTVIDVDIIFAKARVHCVACLAHC